MSQVRSYSKPFELVDRTAELLLLPQTWTLLGDSGLFVSESISTPTVTFEERSGSLAIVGDKVRGSRPQTTSEDVRKVHSYTTTHHPLEDALYPDTVAAKSQYGTDQGFDTEAAAMLRKMEKIRKSFDVTLEVARFKTLGTGNVWAPNGTIAGNFYSDYGLTRNEVDFVLGTATTDIIAKCNEIVAGFQASASEGQIITEVIGYASPAFFAKLLAHAKVTQTHIYQQIGQFNITQQRAGAGLYRRLSFGGINFVEVPTVLGGQALVTAGDCVFVAKEDSGSFVTYFAPPNRFGYVNTAGESSYVWTFRNERMTEITIEAEMNMLNVLKKPNFVARGYSSN